MNHLKMKYNPKATLGAICVILISFMTQTNLCCAQDMRVFDLDLDGSSDTLRHDPATNVFTALHSGSQKVAQSIRFFEEFGEGTANMSYGLSNGYLWFSIRFAPKYLDQDTLWFRYDHKKSDWRLIKMATYNFNTMDPRLVSISCSFRLKQTVWLLTDRYQRVQTLAENRKNRISEKCIERQEH